ncbi:MAG: right-handed parallel beta-helix repeat-containing protein [Chitinophagaceae bacterium]|nr:right-handed parallel beta-helix repeat-containing protein [Chitinophagaceae bacterium]
MRKEMRKMLWVIGISMTSFTVTAQQAVSILSFGAKGDGKTLATKSIQKAIDQVAAKGGGKVIIPAPGVFMSGTIHLRSNINLEVEAGATLLGSPNIKDYDSVTWGHNIDRQPYHLLFADSASNLMISGKGTIDGNGQAFWKEWEKDDKGQMVIPRWLLAKPRKVSPLIEIYRCFNVSIQDITIRTGGGWNLHLYNSDVVKVRGINIDNNIYSPNSDGIDITGCNDVIVSDCYIKTCDDAICLKTTKDSRSCNRITVNNCILETLCVGLKMGCNESNKDMTDITFSNCIINKSSRAIGIYVKDGAVYDRITISNIVSNTNAPLIFNRPIQIMVNGLQPDSKPGIIRNVLISNFVCETEGRILLTSYEGGLIENIQLQNITLRYPMIEDPLPMVAGSGSAQFPKIKEHPEAVGARAAIVAENIRNLVIENLNIQWPQTDTTPLLWAHPERIENGSARIHRMNYDKARQTEFSVFWGNKIQGGYLSNRLASSSSQGISKYEIRNSSIEVIK